MQPRAVLFFPLFHGKHPATEVGKLRQFLLDFLQAFMPPAVSNLGLCFRVGLAAILLVQLLELSDFSAKIPDLFTKHCEMIHDIRITHSQRFVVYRGQIGFFGLTGKMGTAGTAAAWEGISSGGSIIG